MDYMELSINDFTDSLLDWGSDIFDDILEWCAVAEIDEELDADTANAVYNEALDKVYSDCEYFGFYRSHMPNRTDVIKYLSELTSNFDGLFCAAALEDMMRRYYVYVKKIWHISFYMINHKARHPLIDNTLNSIHADLKAGRDVGCSQILNYWDILDNSLFDYAINILKTHMDKFPAPESRWSQPEQPTLPADMDTERARKYLHKAEDAGLITKTSTGYRWTSILGRGQLAQLAYFCNRIYCPNNTETLPETSINLFFGVSRVGSALTQVQNAKKPQKWRKAIDCIFED